MDNYQYKVLVDCKTYNHVNYIEDALNGFCMQETKFPFICVVMDDASTDGEQNVINDYLERNFDLTDKQFCSQEETEDYRLLLVRHKNNLNCYFAVFFLKYNHYGKKDKFPYYERWVKRSKYIAMCEGDDYWIDPLKLQKQVDFLEKNTNYGLVYGCVNIYNEEKRKIVKKWGGASESFPDLIKESTIPTLTVLIKRSVYFDYLDTIKPGNKGWLMGDYPLWLYASYNSLIKFMPEIEGVYRLLGESASHSKDIKKNEEFIRNLFDMKKFYASFYNYQYIFDNSLYMSLARNAFLHQNREKTSEYISKMDKRNLKYKIMKIVSHSDILFNIIFTLYKRFI